MTRTTPTTDLSSYEIVEARVKSGKLARRDRLSQYCDFPNPRESHTRMSLVFTSRLDCSALQSVYLTKASLLAWFA